MYRVEPVQSRGLGCLAKENIARGSLINRERPVLAVSVGVRELEMRMVEEIFVGCEVERVELEKEKLEFRTVVDSFSKLSDMDKIKYLGLKYQENAKADTAVMEAFGDFDDPEVSIHIFMKICSIYTTNTFKNGVCLEMSRFNHSCWPNAECFWNEETKTRDIVALEDITGGDEICHNYLQRCHLATERQYMLLTKWNFCCSCRLCCTPVDESRRKQYIRVEKIVFDKDCEAASMLDMVEAVKSYNHVQGVRVLSTIKLLDAAFIAATRSILLTKEDRIILHDISVKGVEYSNLLFNRNHKISLLWQERLDRPGLHAVKLKCLKLTQTAWLLATSVLILWNFYNLNCIQYLLLLGALLFNQKMF